MSDIIQRLTSLLSSNAATVGTSAVQISGGPAANWPLTGVAASFFPNYHRQVLRVTNCSSAATIYLGSTSSVTTASGWFKSLAPGQMIEIDINGSVPVWVIASAASTAISIDELS